MVVYLDFYAAEALLHRDEVLGELLVPSLVHPSGLAGTVDRLRVALKFMSICCELLCEMPFGCLEGFEGLPPLGYLGLGCLCLPLLLGDEVV